MSKPIRDKQIAAETELTTKAMEKTAETENEVEQAQRMIQQEVAKVQADTKLQVGKIDQEVDNVTVRTDAALEKLGPSTLARSLIWMPSGPSRRVRRKCR